MSFNKHINNIMLTSCSYTNCGKSVGKMRTSTGVIILGVGIALTLFLIEIISENTTLGFDLPWLAFVAPIPLSWSLLIGFTIRAKEEEKLRKQITLILMNNDRVKIDEAASSVGISREKAEKIIMDLQSKGTIMGRMTKDGVFVNAISASTGGIKEREIVFIRCRYCGAKVPETQTKCPKCGADL